MALVINLIIIVLEIVGVVLSVRRHGVKVFHFYTENSNYFALLVSFVFCVHCIVALLRKTRIKKWILLLRYVSTVCLVITLIIVLLVLIPMFPSTATFMLWRDSNLYQHTLCPLLSVTSFFVFERQDKLPKYALFIGMLPTIFYGVVCIILNILKVMMGPYPFFYVYVLPWYITLSSILVVFLVAIMIVCIIYFLYNRWQK